MVSRDYDSYESPYYIAIRERSVIDIRIDYWFNLWKIIGVYIRNPIRVMLTEEARCEKERDYG